MEKKYDKTEVELYVEEGCKFGANTSLIAKVCMSIYSNAYTVSYSQRHLVLIYAMWGLEYAEMSSVAII